MKLTDKVLAVLKDNSGTNMTARVLAERIGGTNSRSVSMACQWLHARGLVVKLPNKPFIWGLPR